MVFHAESHAEDWIYVELAIPFLFRAENKNTETLCGKNIDDALRNIVISAASLHSTHTTSFKTQTCIFRII